MDDSLSYDDSAEVSEFLVISLSYDDSVEASDFLVSSYSIIL